MEVLIGWLVAAAVIALIARATGRDAADYFWGAVIFTPIIGVYALVVGRRETS